MFFGCWAALVAAGAGFPDESPNAWRIAPPNASTPRTTMTHVFGPRLYCGWCPPDRYACDGGPYGCCCGGW
ncbi:hypothetical protein Mco01_28780 [Microbispora corallina]|uniref:Secreted protein n=1 Tax=Microbispora corallina TaxID=83302 RepID=A0ABQ4FYL3_9ACTN|nr:hypothetical protein Mco01_28780 [Microbispora corallina]